jgi:hypothetical protein
MLIRSKYIRIASIMAMLAIFSCSTMGQQQGYDLSAGGQPTITGGLNATVTGSTDPTQNLSVTINFGEVTPVNTNSIVNVTVPIAIRSLQPYQVTATAVTSFPSDGRTVQATDIGFGITNMRPLGLKGQLCTRSTHMITSLFNNDPASTLFLNNSGRAAYSSTVANLGSSTLIMTGPKLTQGTGITRTTEDGWVFNAVFAITPQFYAAGSYSLTITFAIASGPNVQC